MTYSVVARDAGTGQIGVAVQTAMFAVGATVPWAQAGVGAVASQSITEPAYGPRCLTAMADGATASAALDRARAGDPLSALRQVGVVDGSGASTAFTGELCVDHCGHRVGDGYAVQANMMSNPDVWPAMASALEESHRDVSLASRLLHCLRAGEQAGGDARGQMAAAMVVVDGQRRDDAPWAGRIVDIRVDRADAPLDELSRLLEAAQAFEGFNRGVEELMAGEGAAALSSFDAGLTLLPDEQNLRIARAGALALTGRQVEALSELRAVIAERPTWRIVVDSFEAKGLIQLPGQLDP